MDEEQEEEILANPSLLLIREKEGFKKDIEERIRQGNEILSMKTFNGFDDETRQKNLPFFSKYESWDKANITILKNAFNDSDNEYLKDYNEKNVASTLNPPMSVFNNPQVIKTKNALICQIGVWENLKNSLNYIQSSLNKAAESVNDTISPITSSKDVFIVHGHDEVMKEKVARFLIELELNPIILHEKVNGGKTIIEKLEGNASSVGFAVILLTADDEGRAKKETNYHDRARQNVIFEMGLFMGLIGRSRVALLRAEGLEDPSDVSGLVYISIDSGDGWKMSLCDELKAAGYDVDKNKI
jgi:Predicted nucleotide-binding protein containing TIR -like domain